MSSPLSRAVRDAQAHYKGRKPASPDIPTVWMGKDIIDGRVMPVLTIIFRTGGCRWGTCTMCGYVHDSLPSVSHENLLAQFEYAVSRCGEPEFAVKIFTSGSFLDEKEVEIRARDDILARFTAGGRVKKVIAETRPEFVTPGTLEGCREALGGIPFEVAIGIETSNDGIRKDCINKGFTFPDFRQASLTAKSLGVTTKAYLLLKPPFLAEGAAMRDAMRSVDDIVPYAGTISLNLCTVQAGTLVNEMWERGDYRPPWLWSAAEVLIRAKKAHPGTVIMSDPVGAGATRGPHNCRECSAAVASAIRAYSLSQDTSVLEKLTCGCKSHWEKVVEFEDFAFGAPLTTF